MKITKNLALYLLVLFSALTGCKKDTVSRISTNGDFVVNFDFTPPSVFAPAKVVLLNRTKNAERYLWKYDTLKTITTNADTLVASSSESIVPDTLLFDFPGTYKITLTAWIGKKEETITKELIVKKSQPEIVLPQNASIFKELTFNAKIFKYPNKPVSYQWNFGDGGTSSEAVPTHSYDDAGIYTVTLTINDGEETLTTTAQHLVLDELAKALYFTDAKTKKLIKLRLTALKPSSPVSLPADVGIHPLSVSVYREKVIISDAGVGIIFTSATSDGKIFSVDLNGLNNTTITQPPAGSAYGDDPFCSTVDENGTVYFVTRFGGMRSVSANAVDAAYPAVRISVSAANAGVSSTYGWLDGNIQIVNGEVWYSKHGSAGKGLYRYSMAGAFIGSVPGLTDVRLRSFAVDTQRGKIYFAVNFTGGGYGPGLYKCNLDGSGIVQVDALTGFSTEGGANELTSITGIVVDNASGYVYYPFRAESDINSTGVVNGTGSNSGIKRYPLDGTAAPEFFVRGFIPYGIGIDNVPR